MAREKGARHVKDLVARLRARVESPPLARRPVGDPVHLCHLVPQMDTGGVASNALEVCNGLNTDDFMASILCVDQRGVAAERVEPRVQVWALHNHERGEPGPREVLRMADLLRRYAVDVLHVHGAGWYYPAAVLAARLAGVGHVVLTGHRVTDDGPAALWNLVGPRVTGWTDRFTATSPAVAARLAGRLGVAPERVQIIPKGVDTDRYRPPLDREAARAAMGIQPDEVALGMVGRVIPERGHMVLLDAAANNFEEMGPWREGASVKLLMVGKGPERDRVFERARKLGLERVITMVDGYADMPAFYAALDLFVVPGRHDGISSAALEAMATGHPVVAANAGANMEAVKDGETGMLVPQDNPSVLARILAQLVDDPARRQTLGQRARQHVEEHHRAETMVQRHSALYHGLNWIQVKEDQS